METEGGVGGESDISMWSQKDVIKRLVANGWMWRCKRSVGGQDGRHEDLNKRSVYRIERVIERT